MTPELRQISMNPAVQRMMKYSFIGSKDTVKVQIAKFLEETGVDEIMVASHIYDPEARIHSYRLFSEIMEELENEQEQVLN